jgi:hypothetical protein
MRQQMTFFQFVIFAWMVPFSIARGGYNQNQHQALSSSTPSWHWSPPAATPKTSASEYRRLRVEQKQQQQNNPIASNLRAGAMAPTVPLKNSLSYYLRVALAGGVAGATGTAVLYPMDSAKT